MKKYELNQWYKIPDDNYNIVFYAQKIEKGILYGFSNFGEWSEYARSKYNKNHSMVKATEKEVKDLLLSESKVRYSNAERVNYLDTGNGAIKGRSFVYDNSIIYATDYPEKKDIIFKEGKWAEWVEVKYLTKKQAEKMITDIKNDGNEYKIMNSIVDYR